MTTLEILDLESKNEDSIIVFVSPLYNKVYERSAFRLKKSSVGNKLLVFKRNVKKVNRDLVSICIDAHLFEYLQQSLTLVESSEHYLRFAIPEEVDMAEYESWWESIAFKTPLSHKRANALTEKKDRLYNMVVNYDMLQASPIECFSFIQELKSVVNSK